MWRSLHDEVPGRLDLSDARVGNPDATGATIDADGRLYTGDIARIDADGALFVVDRVKELIKVKGFQVAPAELEAVLHTTRASPRPRWCRCPTSAQVRYRMRSWCPRAMAWIPTS